MLHLKNLEVLNIHPILKKIVVEDVIVLGLDVITSAYRPGDPRCHGTLPLRALDFRCRVAFIGEMVAAYINERWLYDPNRPHMKVCMFHDTGKGYHLHIQVHPNTIRRH